VIPIARMLTHQGSSSSVQWNCVRLVFTGVYVYSVASNDMFLGRKLDF